MPCQMKARFTFGSILSPPKACKYLRFDVCAGARSKAAFGCIPNNISCLVLLAFLLIIIIIIFVSSAPCTVNCTALHCYYTGKYPVIMQEVVNIYGTLHSPRASKQIPSILMSISHDMKKGEGGFSLSRSVTFGELLPIKLKCDTRRLIRLNLPV